MRALRVYAAAFLAVAASSPAAPAAEAEPRPLPIPEMLALLGREREKAPAGVVGASLLEAMRQASQTPAFAEACARLAEPSP